MSRWLFPWSGSIKKRACRYLLQHYLGHFLQERLSLDQLGLDLYNGSGIIKEINLDVWAVNELLESLGAPLEIVDGFVESIKVAIPWQALLSDHCTLEVSGLQITCQPKYRTNGGWDSQGWSSSMTSSMQLAKECLKDPPEASEEPPAPLEGLEMFAQTIETVLRRIKVTFLDTIVRIEHHPPELRTGVALEVHIKRLEYFDEAVRDPSSQTAVPVDIHQPPAFLHKILQLSAVQLFYDGTGMPLLIGRCSGFMETTIKIKQNDMLPGPKVCAALSKLLIKYNPSLLTTCVFSSLLISWSWMGRWAVVCVHFNVDLVTVCVCAEMFYSMGPAGMSSSVTSVRSGSEMSDSDMESSTHSLTGLTQPASGRIRGKISAEQLKPDALMRVTIGGLTLTLLEENPPFKSDGASSLAQVSQTFFERLDSFKDSMFSDKTFNSLRVSFTKACPLSHLRLTGAAVQVVCEMRSGKRRGQTVTSDLSFSRLELLECLWEDEKPQYCEVVNLACDSSNSLITCASNLSAPRVRGCPSCVCVLKFAQHLNKLFILSMTDPVGTYVVNIFSLSSQTQSSELSSSFTLRSPNAVVRLRFPIPDLRPLPKRRPPTQKAVREETLVLELMELELKHQEAPDLQNERAAPGQPWGPCLTQLLEASFTDMHGGSNLGSNRSSSRLIQMVIPADQEEMLQFQEQCVARCQCAVDISLPLAYVLLPSKQAFQSIYNRINNDLLMWEPPPPPPPSAHSPEQSRQSHDEFQLCKSAFRLGELDCSDGKNVIVVLDLLCKINSLCVKMEDQTYGEIVLDLEGGKIFSVAQHQNDPNLSFLCLESKRVELYHQAVVKNTPIPERLDMPSFSPPKHLDPTIYPTEVGVSSVSGREGQSQMLSTAIKITLDLDRNVKEFLVALQLQGATIQHYMTQSNQSWHEQLVEFLDVIDDPILGYTPPAIITVLHTHLATCAVDYRPLYLPLRVLFTAESFSLSTNIIVDTATFHLRFILDDSALYLSDKCETDTVDLRRDYVCVLDIDLLELAITTWKGSDTGKLTQPLFELRCSNNVVHLHTCADSCAALINMLQYLISQGDLHPPPRHSSPTEIAGQKLPMSESPASLLPFPPAETAEINQYDLADALIDTEKSHREDSTEPVPRGSPVSVYLFPGEASKRIPAGLQREDSDLDGLVPTAMEAQADMMSDEGSEGSTDNDDFCILEAPGMGIPPRDGEPVVTVLSQGPIRVKDSHFSRPRGSSDLLRAPSGFPVPHSRVVLREISVVWHLYGGKDFGTPWFFSRGRSAPAGVRASLSRTATAARPQNSWRWTGGSGRQHTLLMEIQLTKVSFQHESYPVAVVGQDGEGAGPAGVGVLPSGEQPLCRQVFIVQELEVRDRLASSQINKFLYLYTSESMPRRAHSNMLTVKALQVLPESGLGGPECCLRVSLLPLRLNIDQDALFFLKDFFSNLASFVNPYLPVDSAAEGQLLNKWGKDFSVIKILVNVTENRKLLKGRNISKKKKYIISLLVFDFREFRFTSEVPIWLDYHGKHVVIEQGTFAGILIGLAQLNCSELKLKRLCCRHGLLGVDKVVQYAVTEWQTDITKNQLPGILGGVGPMHSVVQLFHGVRDLFWLPIEQYRKDGRIIRGLQRGAASFGTSTASAALELSNRLVQAIQATAETVYDILSPTPPLSRYAITEGRTPSSRPRRAAQPADLREGVAKAYDTVREGVIDTAQTLCDVASRGHEQKGLPGAVGGVLRQIPPTVVRPLIVASEATSNLLGGMRNQIKPDARKEDFLKWRIEDAQE
uniref:Autophagy related 2A n=1 Tax=Nothobranchius furzeri TaxID=105023 RepID=A0A8C6L8S7_NOTFU